MNKISIQEISEIVSKETNQTKKLSEQFLRELVNVIAEYLQKDGIAKVKGLGTFKVITVEERKSVDVTTGKEIILPAHNKIQFTAEENVKKSVNSIEPNVNKEKPAPSKEQDSNNRITESPNNKEITEEPKQQGNTEETKHQEEDSKSGGKSNKLLWIVIVVLLVDLIALAYATAPYWEPYIYKLINKDTVQEELEYEPVAVEPVPIDTMAVADDVDSVSVDSANVDTVDMVEAVEPANEVEPAITLENYTYKMAMEVPVRGTETVIDGSRLTMIAYRAYGSKEFWVYIYDANRDVLNRPSDIAKGMTIKIADLPMSIVDPDNPACIEKARELAKIY